MKELEAVATAAARDGHRVHVLADDRLAVEDEDRTLPGIAGVHRVSPRWVRAAQRGQRLSKLGRGRWWLKAVLPLRYVGYALFQRALVRGVAQCARELGGVPTLVLSWHLRVHWAVALAPRTARWAVYEHAPSKGPPGVGLLSRVFGWQERRRRAAGGWIRVIANNPTAEARCKERSPYLDFVLCPLAGVVTRTCIDRLAARATLGFPADGRIALSFGVSHDGKDLETTLLAFAGEQAPGRLVLAGAGCGQTFLDTVARHPTLDFSAVTVLDGPQSDEMKRLLHSAADYVVLSYRRHRDIDSGPLADAIGFGIPVCCSDDSTAGELVRRYQLGIVFAAENADALRIAADQMNAFVLGDEDRARYVDDWSADGISRRLVAATVQSRLDA
ncbi:MAG: D-inositol-3-phosphate glycosyltransferase [Acidimicrobiaceae bacterium]